MSEWPLFSRYGIEMEYMIVDANTLNVSPIADKLFAQVGAPEGEFFHQKMGWSNELALHIVEIKTDDPAKELSTLPALFNQEINDIGRLLLPHGAKLMPTGAHPWMNPLTEAVLWPNENNEIYQSYHRIFDCRGHGWVNLQSTHLNLPFANDAQFHLLHSAIRVLLPLLPALAASTPILDNKISGLLDTRLSFYGGNQQRIPQISASIIPEVVESEATYNTRILKPMFNAIAPHDPDGHLQHEWLNSRAAIARFERMAIEIRILDIQETPAMDIALIALIVEVIKLLTEGRFADIKRQDIFHEKTLLALYQRVIESGNHALIEEPAYLSLFGFQGKKATVGDLWQHLFSTVENSIAWAKPQLKIVLTQGSLAERMLKTYRQDPTPNQIKKIYEHLCHCLSTHQPYQA